MPQNISTATFVKIAVLWLLPASLCAHVPALRPYLLELLDSSDCVVAGRVVRTEASSRGSGVVLLEKPVSWCGAVFAPTIRVRVATARPANDWYVFFLRKDDAGWLDVSPAGVVFPLQRGDQRHIHRALHRLWQRRRSAPGPEHRAALLSLLMAQAPEWRYQAALELRRLFSLGPALTPPERERLQAILHAETDEALRQLFRQLIDGAQAPAD